MTKQELKAKIRKFLAGIGIITASYVGGHKTANAQEFSDMTDEEKIEYVLNMTDEQKQSRLTELSVSLDSIGKIIEERDSLCKQIRAFIEEKFPFDVYSNIDWKLPAASKYEIMRSELLKFYNQDVLKLRTSYNNGDIGPEEYTRQSQKYDKFFDVLLKTLDGANKNGDLSGAGTIYLASRCLVHRAESILRYKYSKKRMFEEERNAILNPPVLPKQVVKKSRSH